MGCYGIGVTRTVAAIIEQHHDEKGIVWPVSVAPYHVMITVIRPSDEKQMETALHIQDELEKQGVEVLVDDRDERAGVKFNDADLLGYPVMITVGGKASDGIVEYKLRRDEDHMEEISADEAVKRAADLVAAERFGC
jgi:prolyl-tRNA synthetase